MILRTACLAVLLALTVSAAVAQGSSVAVDRDAAVQTAFARAQHLKRGINMSHWFSQSANDYSAQHTNTEVTTDDIALIARMGFDNIRLSIDATPLERGPLGPDGLNAEFMGRLDNALDTMLADGLAVQVDLHPEEPFKLAVRTNNQDVDRLTMLWRKLASHYANRDPERVFFEIMNEPEVNDPYRWAGIQARVAAAIREVAPRHTIIATGPNWSDIQDLLTQHPLSDGNVIYNFHFYDPHEFTHQGAEWGSTWSIYENKIPYPAGEDSMQEHLKDIPDPANRYQLERYWLDHWDAHRIRMMIDAAAEWGRVNHTPLICNEFGVYRRVAEPDARNAWIHDVRTALEADGIGWAMWDFHGGFGVATRKGDEPSQPDPATAEALGLKGR